MKKIMVGLFVASLLLVAVVAFADKTVPVYKKGDAVMVCGCGENCECKTMARKDGKCSCGKELVKGIVSSDEGGKLVVTVGGKDLNFPANAKFACGCGEGCNCGTISQKPGKCACGKEMMEVK
jgi:hypothetical protein